VIARSADVLRERLRSRDVGPFSVEAHPGSGTIDVVVPEKQAAALDGLGDTGRLEERAVARTIAPTDAGYTTTPLTPLDPATNGFAPSDPRGRVVAYEDTNRNGAFTDGVDAKHELEKVEITGTDLEEASAHFISGGANFANSGWRVEFTLTPEGSGKFAETTTRLIGRQLAILVDGVVLSAPTVQSPITGGQGEITGSYTEAEAKDLAATLNAAPLPVVLAPSAPASARIDGRVGWSLAGAVMAGVGAAGLVLGWAWRRRAA
jgi:preprotein translocase subunit SecD